MPTTRRVALLILLAACMWISARPALAQPQGPCPRGDGINPCESIITIDSPLMTFVPRACDPL